ncbi:M6 family metalloprotease domain-containing protein [Methylobacterium terrae]|nr:M6 family metalloprotease domain-containing protein [Methylobacterium terrae]
MRLLSCDCTRLEAGSSYAAGPTACIAHPDVLENIKHQVVSGQVLSTADAKLAARAGWLGIPKIARSGFNDGVVYPPSQTDAQALRDEAGRPPTKQLALPAPDAKTTLNCLVLLVDFSDLPGQQTPSHYRTLLFDSGNPDSMNRFYWDLSGHKLDVTGQVVGWLRAEHPYAYYVDGQSGTGDGFPRNTPGLLDEILRRYCDGNSLKPFDVNGDGYLDGLFLVHAGGGAEAEAEPLRRKSLIWSHKWTLPEPFTNDGVKAYAYFTAPENGRLGVFSHEFGHFLGLPDLYDTSYRSAGVGNWCLMGGGSWNGGGERPSRMSAWCLEQLGWIRPQPLTASASLALDTLEKDASACYRIDSVSEAREYFLLENRQQAGRDDKLPGSGLALWHIDETQSDNTNPLAYKVALVQADGRRDLEFGRKPDDPADLFPGQAAVRSVDDRGAKHPHTRWNDGTASGIALTEITEEDGIVTVDVTLKEVAVS